MCIEDGASVHVRRTGTRACDGIGRSERAYKCALGEGAGQAGRAHREGKGRDEARSRLVGTAELE